MHLTCREEVAILTNRSSYSYFVATNNIQASLLFILDKFE